MKKVLSSLLVSTILLQATPIQINSYAQENNLQEELVNVWTQRTVDQIRKALNHMTQNKEEVYIIQWGDTLVSIAEATGISVNDLAQINQISNPDLIIAGAELRFNSNSNTISYSVGQEEVTVQAFETVITKDPAEANLVAIEKAIDFPLEAEQEPVLVADKSDITESQVAVNDEFTSEVELSEELPVSFEETFESQSTTEWLENTDTTMELNQNEELSETSVETTLEVPTTVVESTSEEVTFEETTVEEVTFPETSVPEKSQELETTVADNSFTMDPRAAFEKIVAEKGLSATEKNYWEHIINRESGWNMQAKNPSSGAYGLPQALPGSKMASHGADWQTNPYTQLAWMYDYMINRYGSIYGAWSHSQNHGWY